jgi:protein deglycase
VPVANGSEEIEAVCIIDTLRRAEIEVVVAGVPHRSIVASRGTKLTADCAIDECLDQEYDVIALPGGMPGAEHLRDSSALIRMLKKQQELGRLYAAICASPAVVFQPHGLLGDRPATCHPSFAERIGNGEAIASRVVEAGNCITSQGPGTALEFSLTIVKHLAGLEKAIQIARAMVMLPEQMPSLAKRRALRSGEQ